MYVSNFGCDVFLHLNSDKDGLDSKENPALIGKQVPTTATATTELWVMCLLGTSWID